MSRFWSLPILPGALYARRGRHDALDLILIILAASIGIGSFLFHTFATGWSELRM